MWSWSEYFKVIGNKKSNFIFTVQFIQTIVKNCDYKNTNMILQTVLLFQTLQKLSGDIKYKVNTCICNLEICYNKEFLSAFKF